MQRESEGEDVVKLIQSYDRAIARYRDELAKANEQIKLLQNKVNELNNIINMERVKATAEEARTEYLESEIKGLLKGKADATKQAVQLILMMDEQFGTIRNAAKYLRRSAVPWGLIGLAVVLAAVAIPTAWILQNPENMQLLIMWANQPVNQLIIGGAIISALVIALAVLALRRRGKT